MAEENIITLSEELVKKLKSKLKETEFNSVQEYVKFILEQVVSEEDKEGYSKEEEEAIKENLKDLGYL